MSLVDDHPTEETPAGARQQLEEALFEVKRVIVGQDAMLERLIVALLTGGHVLLEGVPGLAKTLTVRTVAEVLGGSFRRVQFTPDLVPVGPRRHPRLPPRHRPLRRRARPGLRQRPAGRRDQPRAREGAGRAARGHAGAPGDDRRGDLQGPRAVPRPRDAEPDRVRGHLPAARGADRPLPLQARRRLPEPGRRGLRRRPLARGRRRRPRAAPARRPPAPPRGRPRRSSSTGRSSATRSRSPTRRATRPNTGCPSSRGYIEFGASPRGPIGLVQAARALALLRGRGHVVPQDVHDLALDVLRHRIVLRYEALAENVTADDVVTRVLEAVPMPSQPHARPHPDVSSDRRVAARPARPPGPGSRPARADRGARAAAAPTHRRAPSRGAPCRRRWRRRGARPAAALRARRRRPRPRPRRHRPDRHAARPRPRARARAHHLGRARRLRLHGLRDGGPAEGRRGRGRRHRRGAPRHPPRQPHGPAHLRRGRGARAPAARRPRRDHPPAPRARRGRRDGRRRRRGARGRPAPGRRAGPRPRPRRRDLRLPRGPRRRGSARSGRCATATT